MPKVKLFFTLVISVLLLAISGNKSYAQYTSITEHITSFSSSTVINKDGSIDVTEDISYDFGPNQRHGIYRDIPYIKVNSDNKKYVLDIKNIQVEQSQFTVTDLKQNGISYKRIKIGDPLTLVSGKINYIISYKVYGALTYFSDHDELYWNLTGNNWQVPITQFSAQVFVPDNNTQNIMVACYTGTYGSTHQDCTATKTSALAGTSVQISSNRMLTSGEGISVVVGFPKGLVSIVKPAPYKDYSFFLPLLYVLFSFVVISLHAFVFYQWYQDKRNTERKQKIVAAWFDPPKFSDGTLFTPAETAGLVNKAVDYHSVTATIVHLAQRGYLKIVVDAKNNVSFIKKADWLSDDTKVKNFERTLLNALFDSGDRSVVTMKDLKNDQTFGVEVMTSYKKVMTDLYTAGMFIDDPINNQKVFGLLIALATFVSFSFFILSIPFAIVSWILMSKTVRKTDLGIEKYSEGKSLLNFLKSQKDQLDFQSKNQMFFEKLLPYATAFGVEKIWAERFKDLQFTQSDWYQGTSYGSIAYLASINTIGTRMMSMSTTRSSSGFSSGFSGGFSGGGGGGGGGGSW